MIEYRLPLPQIDTEMLVDEAIWGHRFHDEQTPWLTLLEFLCVAQAEYEDGRVFIESTPNSLRYRPYIRLYLRNILFNNPRIATIHKEYPDDETRWKHWLDAISKEKAGLDNPDFSYLKRRFASFSDFLAVIDFLRSTSIEGNSNKRWSSKFVFPYGPHCLYEDLNVKSTGGFSNDRRFFARTGELLYLMLTRSDKGQEILSFLKPLLFSKETKWNRLAESLQLDDEPRNERSGAYLPYITLPDYSNLADDWLNLFRCNMPGYDIYPYLVRITGLHLIMYFLNRSRDVMGLPCKASFVLEILSPKKTIIRDLASDSYSDNNNLSRQAIEKYIRRIAEKDIWKDALNSVDPFGAAIEILNNEFKWPDKDNMSNTGKPDTLLDKLCEKAINRHKQHVYKFHGTWGKEIGLSSSRGSRRTRYAPTDALLKTLVLCTVPGRMEFQEFLTFLYEKYGFIIGDRQADDYITRGHADQEAFSDNAIRLEQRLTSLGLLNRLSDACAYVENPFHQEENQ
jgi:hypothetical protein